MKKILALILLVICVLTFTACGIKADSENSYIISIYRVEASQKENGEIVFEGYTLKDSFQVIKTQCFEIDDYEIIEENGIEKLGKYKYSNLPSSYIMIESRKIQVFPNGDKTIYVREREKKDINLHLGGKPIAFTSSSMKEEYYSQFIGTYEEDFVLSASFVEQMISSINGPITIELYTNSNLLGDPFAKATFSYSGYSGLSGSLSFSLIKTTDVFMGIWQN